MTSEQNSFEDFEDEGVWDEVDSSRSALDTARALKWKLLIEGMVAAAGLAWITMYPVQGHVSHKTHVTVAQKPAPSALPIPKTAPPRTHMAGNVAHVDVPKSSMRWLSDMTSTGASYEMITQTPEIAAAMQAVEVARAHIDAGQDSRVAIARAARTIGYIPAVTLGGEASSSQSHVVTGTAEAVSGDVIKLDGHLIHLDGVRAPDGKDSCKTGSGGTYDCQAWSKKGLAIMLKGSEISCRIDNSDVPVTGVCEMLGAGFNGDRDIARIGVSSGLMLAVPGSDSLSPYQSSQDNAQLMKNGIWSGRFKSGTP